MSRQAIIGLIIGMRNSGKSYFCLNEIVYKYPKKVLIIDTIDHEKYREFQILTSQAQVKAWRSGIKRWVTNDLRIKEDMQFFNQTLNNCLVVFEDATKYFRTNAPKELFQLLYDSKQKGIDVILMYHGFKKILPEILDNANYIELFPIEEKIQKYEHKIPRYEQVESVLGELLNSPKPYPHKSILIN